MASVPGSGGGSGSQFTAIADRMEQNALVQAEFQAKIADTAGKMNTANSATNKLVSKG